MKSNLDILLKRVIGTGSMVHYFGSINLPQRDFNSNNSKHFPIIFPQIPIFA